MWPCDFKSCTTSAVRDKGLCVLCNRCLCIKHMQPKYHECPPWENVDEWCAAYAAKEADKQEIEGLLKKIDISALAEKASSLRMGMACAISPLIYDRKTLADVMGGMNYHVEIRFVDGVVWLARTRRVSAKSPPLAVRDSILASEVATLKFLAGTNVPTPAVYGYDFEGPGNPVGVSYMLQEKMPGHKCNLRQATPEQKTTFLRDLADIFIELSAHPLDALGSLVLEPELHIGPFANEELTDIDSRSTIQTQGPFKTLNESRTAEVQCILDRIRRQEMYVSEPVDAYLIHLFLMDIIPRMADPVIPWNKEAPCFLKHADDKGDHILVDDDFHITAIIDWEWAYSAPAALAFISPVGLLDVGEFYDGENGLSAAEQMLARSLEEKGRADLADHVWNGRIHHRFNFCVGYFSNRRDDFVGLFRGLRKIVDVDADLEWPEWKDVALARYSGDEGLQQVLKMQENITVHS